MGLGSFIGNLLGIEKVVVQQAQTVDSILKSGADLQSESDKLVKESNNALNAYNAKLDAIIKQQNEEAAKKAAKEEADQRATEERNAQVKAELVGQSQEFERQRGGLGQSAAAIAGEQVRQDLGASLKDVGQAANRRGLLYSGIKEQAAQGLRDEASANLMAEQQKINEDLAAQSEAYNKMAAEGVNANQDLVYGNMANRQQNAQNAYQQGLQARRAKLQNKSGVRSLISSAKQGQTSFLNAYDDLKESSFDPQSYQQIGQGIGAVGTSLYNKMNKKDGVNNG